MKLQYTQSTVDNTGSLEHRRATIDLNPTIAHVLSRDLYQRPIESMFREIVINAIDAHREAGQTKPVSIHVPTMWDETFFVRDYGTGLPHDQFMNIYLAYGESSRRDSDKVHGGLGLGTKSPLAYTSTFAVTSYTEGTKNDYMVYYDEDNLPCVDHRASNPTTEPNGLRVSLTTGSSNDYNNFHDAAKAILKRIPADQYTIENNNAAGIVIKAEDVAKYGRIGLKSSPGISIVMGYVAYEIDVNAVIQYLENKASVIAFGSSTFEAANVIRRLTSDRGIEIYSDISTYSVHPSREYVNVTPRAAKQLCRDISEGMEVLFKDQDELNITQDTLQHALSGIIPPAKAGIRIRGRFLYYNGWGSSTHTRIAPQTNTYEEFIHYMHNHAVTDLLVCGLVSTELTDYLGNGRREFDFTHLTAIDKDLISYGTKRHIFVYDKDVLNIEPFVTAVAAVSTPLDMSEDIVRFSMKRAERDANDANNAYATYTPRTPRAVTKSMQDVSHNVLTLNTHSSGRHKVDWTSAKHNAETLKELGRRIFWVPTHQGCVKKSDDLSIINAFGAVRNSFPLWRVPVIIGLPASKGTKTIEAAFEPLAELKTYMEEVMSTDSYKRKQELKAANRYNTLAHRSHAYAAYGTVSWLLRLRSLCTKYRIGNVEDSEAVASDLITRVDTYIREAHIRLPHVSGHMYTEFHEADAKAWAEELADLVNNKPTGARAKNDPYYLSRR